MNKDYISLLVLPDTYLIQGYSGFIGKLFAAIYCQILKIRFFFFKLLYTDKKNLVILTPEYFKPRNDEFHRIIYYSQEISNIDISKFRKKSLDYYEKFKSLLSKDSASNLDLWKAQITVTLSYQIFPYFELIEKIIEEYKPQLIYLTGESKEEKITEIIANKMNIKLKKIFFLDLSRLNNKLLEFLFKRQINKKKEIFFVESEPVKNNFGKNPIILSADFFRHLKTLVPLYKKFKQKGEQALFVVDNPLTQNILKNLYKIDTDILNIGDFLDLPIKKSLINSYIKESLGLWKNVVCEDEIFAVYEWYFKNVILNVLPLARLYSRLAEDLIQNLKPNFLLSVNNVRLLENSLLNSFQKKGIKTLIAHQAMFLSADKTTNFKADYFSAVGPTIKDQLINIGYPQNKIVVNGDPQFDFLKENKFNKLEVYNKLKIAPDKKVLLLISDRPNPMLSYEEKKKQFIGIFQAVKDIKNIQLVVKPHPTEKTENVISDLECWGITGAIVTDNKKIELYEILSISSVVIIAWSMVGFEAMLFQIPLIVANFQNKNYNLKIPYVSEGGALQAKNKQQIRQYVLSLIDSKSSLRKIQIAKGLAFCAKYYRLPLGGASQRIYSLIKSKID